MMNMISLDFGIQSSTVALMAARGEIEPMPDCAIFSDTEGETQATMDWLKWVRKRLPFPLHIVSKGNLARDLLDYRDGKSKTGANIPFFVLQPDGRIGPVNRSCTRDYKVTPILKKVQEIAGIGRSKPKEVKVIQWLGISLDECHRMKQAPHAWLENRYPLVEMRMTRGDCVAWLKNNGWPVPPRSACWYCPYSSNERWRNLKNNHPSEWAKAVAFDRELRANGGMKVNGQAYLHRRCEPLDEVSLGDESTIDMFGNECEGVCGV